MESIQPSIQLSAPSGPRRPTPYESALGLVDHDPTPPVIPERRLEHSTPHGLFALQAWRTRARLEHDTLMAVNGKPRTLPFDPTMDFKANAENIVRDDWVRLGIWQNEWGRGWPKRSKPTLNRDWLPEPNFTGGPCIPVGAKWAHEMEPVSVWKGVSSLLQRLTSLELPFAWESVAIPASEPGPEPETDPGGGNCRVGSNIRAHVEAIDSRVEIEPGKRSKRGPRRRR